MLAHELTFAVGDSVVGLIVGDPEGAPEGLAVVGLADGTLLGLAVGDKVYEGDIVERACLASCAI